jgi:hypothetical protein
MNLANLAQIIIAIVSYQEYNETAYCYQYVLRDNQIQRCAKNNTIFVYELYPLFMFQVCVNQK